MRCDVYYARDTEVGENHLAPLYVKEFRGFVANTPDRYASLLADGDTNKKF